MSDREDKVSKHVDALEALASGENVSPPAGEAPAEHSSGLMLLSEEEDDEPQAADNALASLAAGQDEEAHADDQADQPAEPAEPDPADQAAHEALQSIAGLTTPSAPGAGRQQRTARFDSHHRRAMSHQYKRTMIPLLIVVGVLLLIFGVVTLMMVMRGGGGDEYTGEATYLKAYGKLFVLVSLPFGAILLLGAWLFHLDTRKPGPRGPGR